MGHEQLIEALESETRDKAQKIVDEAQIKAERLLVNAQEDAEKLRQHKLNAVLEETVRVNTARQNAMSASLKGNLNRLKLSLMEEIFQQSLAQMVQSENKKIQQAMESLLGDLLEHANKYKDLEHKDGKIFAGTLAQKSIKTSVQLEKGDAAGFVFKSNDGTILIESSLQSVLDSMKPELIIELKELLFGEL